MRATYMVVASGVLLFAVACSTKTSSNTTSTSDKTSTFRLDPSDARLLRDVGCDVDGTTPKCEQIKIDASITDRMSALRSAQRQIEKRRRAIADVQASLNKNHDVGATLLAASLSGVDAELIVATVNKTLEINQEELFLTVMGYRCQGSGLSETIVKATDFSQEIAQPENNLSKGILKFDSKQNSINWHVSEKMSPSTELGNYFVETDGEFSLVRNTATPTQMNCFHQRASGVPSTLTDRPLERHTLICESYFLHPGVTAGSKVSGYSVQFQAHTGGKKEVVFLEGQEIEHDAKNTNDPVNSMPVWSATYLSRVDSNDGVLKFIVYNQKTGESRLEIATSNSTLNLSYGFRDPSGDGVLVTCKTK